MINEYLKEFYPPNWFTDLFIYEISFNSLIIFPIPLNLNHFS